MSNVGSIFTGNVGASGLNRSGNVGRAYFDTYTYSLLFNSLLTSFSALLTDLSATYTRAGTKYNLQNSLYVAYGANAFGTDLDPVDAEYGYYPETAATNTLTYSNDKTTASYARNEITVAGNADTAFSPAMNSQKITPNGGNLRHYFKPGILAGSGVLSCFSEIVKADGYRYLAIVRDVASSTANALVFDLQNGDIFQVGSSYQNEKIESIGGGWYRVSFTCQTTDSGTRQPRWTIISNTPATPVTANNSAFAGDGTSGILFNNMQIETGGRASSPIITGASTVTRAADVLSLPRSSLTQLSDSQYALIADYRTDIAPTTEQALVRLTDTTTYGEFAELKRTATLAESKVNSSTFVQADITVANTSFTRSKLGLSAQLNNFSAAQDGVVIGTDVSGIMPILPTVLEIGAFQNVSQLNGHIYNLSIKNRALTQDQMVTETTL